MNFAGSTPRSFTPASAFSQVPSKILGSPPECAAPTIAGSPIYCKPYPDRLFGVSMLPMQSVDLAIEEMRYARSSGGAAGSCGPNPYHGTKMISDPMYEPSWTMVEELDFSLAGTKSRVVLRPL